MKQEKTRNWKIDNIKAILILCVVLGHLLELHLKMDSNKFLHTFIYFFHMPAFVFITGYFASFSWRKIIRNTIYPYILFQMLYILFARNVLHVKITYKLLTPYWLMWYLFAIIAWSLFMFLLKTNRVYGMMLQSIFAFLLALMVGYVPFIGRAFSLSRIIVFFPFYLMGFYMNRIMKSSKWKELFCKSPRDMRIISLIALFAMIIYNALMYKSINRNWLYEATRYARYHYGIQFRAFHMVVACIGIIILFVWIPDKKLPVLSRIGQRTLSIYLLHGFLVKLIGKYRLLVALQTLPEPVETLIIIVLAVVIVTVLSSNIVHKIMNVILRKSHRLKELLVQGA